jgi:tetratricopeptide (TPR) repeat protein
LAAATAAKALAEAEEDTVLRAEAGFLRSRALYWLDRDEEALSACSEAREGYRTTGATEKVAQADDFALTIRLHVNQLDEALQLATSCYVLAKNTPVKGTEGYAMRRLAEVHLRRAEFDQAIDMAEAAVRVHREANSLIGVARAEHLRGRALMEKGELKAAAEVLTEARVLFDAAGSSSEVLTCANDLAFVMGSVGDLSGAVLVNRRIIEEIRSTDQAGDWRLRHAIVRLVDNLVDLKDHASALQVLDEWLEHLESAGPDWTLRRALELKAQVMDELGDLGRAAVAAEKALALTTSGDVDWYTAHVYEIRAKWLLEIGDDQAGVTLAGAIALHIAHGSDERAGELSKFFLPEWDSGIQAA